MLTNKFLHVDQFVLFRLNAQRYALNGENRKFVKGYWGMLPLDFLERVKTFLLKEKTVLLDDEFIVNLGRFVEWSVQLGGTQLGINSKIKNLRVTFDQNQYRQTHVNTIYQNCSLLFEKHNPLLSSLEEEILVDVFEIQRLVFFCILQMPHILQRV